RAPRSMRGEFLTPNFTDAWSSVLRQRMAWRSSSRQFNEPAASRSSRLALQPATRRFMTQIDSLAPDPVVTVGSVTFANDRPISVFAGPCQMESRSHALEMAAALKEICARLGIGLVYKTSF